MKHLNAYSIWGIEQHKDISLPNTQFFRCSLLIVEQGANKSTGFFDVGWRDILEKQKFGLLTDKSCVIITFWAETSVPINSYLAIICLFAEIIDGGFKSKDIGHSSFMTLQQSLFQQIDPNLSNIFDND